MIRLLLGVDVIDIPRFRRFVGCTDQEQLETLFTARELADVAGRADDAPGLAVRFAAKEAVMKALQDVAPFELDWREIEVVREHGVPRIKLHGAVAVQAREQGVEQLALSLSHSCNVALAQVVGTQSSGGAPPSGWGDL